MKKVLTWILSTALLAGSFTGCTSGGDTSSSSKTTGSSSTASLSQSAQPSQSNFDTSKAITVISREDGSGTRGAFTEIFEIIEKNDKGEKVDMTIETADITQSTGVMMTSVADNAYAIGYISMGSLKDTVKPVKIDGAEATVENVKSNTYKISRPFNIAVKDGVSETAQDFINYILSAEGQKVVEENGYISEGNKGAYAPAAVSGKITLAGSSSVSPVMEKLKEAYAKVNPNVTIEINQSDSTSGMNGAMEGICDIGMASRALKDSEIEAGLKGTAIALDGIAVIVNTKNPVENLTPAQVKEIYTGKITAWSGVQG